MNDETKSFLHQLYVLIETAADLADALNQSQADLEGLGLTRVLQATEEAVRAMDAIRDDLETGRPHGLAGMSTTQLIAELVGRGIELTAFGDELVMDYPPSSLAEADWAVLTRRKAEIAAFLFRGGGCEVPDRASVWGRFAGLAVTNSGLNRNRFTFYTNKES